MSKDLFDESTMSFGEHLEALRTHLWKALIGLVIGVIASLAYSKPIIDMVRAPIDQALKDYGQPVEEAPSKSFWETTKAYFGDDSEEPPTPTKPVETDDAQVVSINVDALELQRGLHKADPQHYPLPADDAKSVMIQLAASISGLPKIADIDQQLKPITINVQEAFFTYVKVAMISGLVLSSPWVFFQLWLFVAAGLYPHERKWVYRFLPMSLGLFLGGAAFCFFLVIPIVLEFLLSFNLWLGLLPQIRMSEWISFAVTLPLMFGISFQLPLVMLFMERISIFSADDYREKRRISILVIAVLSMLLTPADPTSMMLMMIPLMILYEFGIWLCGFKAPSASPYADE